MVAKTTALKARLLRPQCLPPTVQNLSEAQKEALHVFNHEVLAALHRLYMVVPSAQADPLIDSYLP